MKKILLLFTLLVAFAVNGFADYYVVGDFTKWTLTPSASVTAMQLLEGTTDTYYADYTPAAGNVYFCLADGDGENEDWGDFNTNHRLSSSEENQNVSSGCYSVALSKNGDRNLYLYADGNTTYRIMLVESTMALTVTKVGLEYYVAGSFTPDGGEEGAGFFGEKWNTSNNKLTLQNDGTYAITFSNVEITAAGSVAYKITNSDWTSCSANNLYKYFAQTGTYDITFTFYINNIDGPVCTAVKTDIPGTAIWTSETPVAAGNILLSADVCAGLKVGDVLHLVVDGVEQGDNNWYAQVYLYDGNNTQLEENVPVGNGGYYDIPFTITGDMLNLIKNNGAKFGGFRYTSKKVTLESQVYTGSENSVWVGSKALTWTQVTVNKVHFINADVKKGYTLKLTYDGNSTNVQINDGSWASLGTPTYASGTATLELTDDNVTALKTNGLVINASGITMKQVEVLEPTSSEVQLTIEGVHIVSTEFDKYADNTPVKFTISNNTDPYESRAGWGIGYIRNIDNWSDNTNAYSLTGLDGQQFDIMLTVGDLKRIAKNGTDSYVPGAYHPQGGITIQLWDVYSLVSVSVIVPEESDYYLVKSDGTNWTVSGKMTEAEGVYTANVSDWAGKYFAIAPTKALNATLDGIEKWSRIVRPVTQGSDWEIDFANYDGETENNENGKVWMIGASNAADVTISYAPQYGTFAITNSIECAMNEYGYATYSNAKKYMVEGATANFVKVPETSAVLVPQAEGAILPAMIGAGKGSGIIISADAGATYYIKSVNQGDDAVDSSENLLAGSGDGSYDITGNFGNDPYKAYIFAAPEGTVGFYLLDMEGNDKTLAAHKAFLAAPISAGVRDFIGFEDVTTGVDSVHSSQFIVHSYYNLNGQRVAQPTKGLYIVDGKKVVIK